ncbi:MAG: hypothetical protein A2785_01680 [Candidatus Chisholmbacteria bacterium RIFCSPHIGHO2_01_FULL_49_18]|nr:MAG: hypothetical protein A2785_01680 [Candidatus Chisholmbacteria bacterium RIFCSPHIGHO2_01_FULL_49_18]
MNDQEIRHGFTSFAELVKLSKDAAARQIGKKEQQTEEGWNFLNDVFGITEKSLRKIGLSLTPAILELTLTDIISERSESALLLVLRHATGGLTLVDQSDASGKLQISPDLKLEKQSSDDEDFTLTCPENVFQVPIRIFNAPTEQVGTSFRGMEQSDSPPMVMSAVIHGIINRWDIDITGDPHGLKSTYIRTVTNPRPRTES